MYRMDRKKTLVWVAVVVLLGYAFFNFYSENARETTADTTILEQLAQRITTLETQVADLEAKVAGVEEQTNAGQPSSDQVTTEPQATVAVVSVQYLNVRAQPNEQALRIGVLTKDAEVNVLGQEGDWSKVQFQNASTELTGWVASRYISVKND